MSSGPDAGGGSPPNFWESEVYGAAPLAYLERIDCDPIFEWIGTHLPVIGQRVHWSSPDLPGAHAGRSFDDEADFQAAVVRQVRQRMRPGSTTLHVGDSLSPFGVRFGSDDAEAVVAAIMEIPEHHYFLSEARDWLVVGSFERDVDTLDSVD